ncbi:MAG TPA: hypothetical protein PKV86_05020 [Syntrophobacteraceae bacterium]|nr:hypothetical protein [Syntrophobacteraceae bacterium]
MKMPSLRAGLDALRDYLKMAPRPLNVIPAKAGIQVLIGVLDPGVRRGDRVSKF